MLPYVKPPTASERRRMAALTSSCACVCCAQMTEAVPLKVECDHLVRGNKRRGHRFTIPLCQWHHRGVCRPGMTAEQMTGRYGPSRAHGSKPFHETFGSDEALLRQADLACKWTEPEKERERSNHSSWKCLPRRIG